MKIIAIDFETYWDSGAYTLAHMGPIEYIRDPRFHALLLGIKVDDNPVMMIEEQNIARAVQALPDDALYVGHNIMGFDGLILSERYGKVLQNVADTQVLMRWCGLSRIMRERHKELTAALGSGVKKPGVDWSDGKRTKADFDPDIWENFKGYCADDVRQAYVNASALLRHAPDWVLDLMNLTFRMAACPAYHVDGGVIMKYLEERKTLWGRYMAFLSKHFVIDSPEALKDMVKEDQCFAMMVSQSGRPLAVRRDARWGTDRCQEAEFAALADDENEVVRALARARIDAARDVVVSRAKTLLNFADGRNMPVMLSPFRARTGRFTAGKEGSPSDRTGLQNLPRSPEHLALRRAIQPPAGYSVVACDSRQIEARVLAFLAGETEMVEAFQQGRDVYCEFADAIYRLPKGTTEQLCREKSAEALRCRAIGKGAVLKLGYGISYRRFAEELWESGVKLKDSYWSHLREARQVIGLYKEKNWHITSFWDICSAALTAMSEGRPFPVFEGLIHAETIDLPGLNSGVCPGVVMPCGFPLLYPDLRLEGGARGSFSFVKAAGGDKRWKRGTIWGTMLAQNITQSLAALICCWQGSQMYRAGIPLAGNTHDSWNAVVPDKDAEAVGQKMQAIMRTTPPWMPADLVLDAEYKIGKDYTIA